MKSGQLLSLKESNSIKTWVSEERPRELLAQKGASSLPLAKLLAIVLRTGSRGVNAEELARRLLNRYLTLRNLDAQPVSQIRHLKGIGMAKAAQLKAAFELGKRLSQEMAHKKKSIESPTDAIHFADSYYGPYLRDAGKEFLCVTLLDRKNKPIRNIEMSRGTVSAAFVNPREILKETLIYNASSIMLIHNHPSGEGEPSPEDVHITERIEEAAGLLGITLLDHIIIGRNREDCFSFRQAGLLRRIPS